MVREKIADIARSVIAGTPLSREQAEWLAGLDDAHLEDLFDGATRIREHFKGNRVRCCSIVAAKVGRCSEDCAFCSQSAHYKTHVQGKTVLDPEDVLQAAAEAVANGADSFGIVNSGYGPSDDEVEHWGQVVQRIREMGSVRACASLGVVTAEQARRLAEFGVERYNHNLQTSRRHFPNIIKTHSYDDRLAALRHLKDAGISLCSGALFGMGETWEDRLDLAFELRELDVEVVPLNFLIPIDGTPLAGQGTMPASECLKIIAVYRFCLPRQEIKICGGRERNIGDLQHRIFEAGADSFLIGNYLTTYGRPADQDRQMVSDLGLELARYRDDMPAGDSHHDQTAGRGAASIRLPVLSANARV
ncbi:MAG TPA: biotin synthase BioB [Phycisphaerae bacterium]|nr:biotin synthase BioB [Phycisphaerae bacterium]HOJ76176.1 biotin synthase BioB [Phycisphaerae bacterium]HOM53534.1 biotin synthase BioB [Phycisphaerae bacterium]HON65230.1 biotin synthase BioB [Phycisphaerae bacterium]HOQ86623.1 biotin synthase BioB [Phycisphaerae bacterium]